MVGDTVNAAARLEELDRMLGISIVLSGEAVADLKGRAAVHGHGWFPSAREKPIKIEVFELLGLRTAILRDVTTLGTWRRATPVRPPLTRRPDSLTRPQR